MSGKGVRSSEGLFLEGFGDDDVGCESGLRRSCDRAWHDARDLHK